MLRQFMMLLSLLMLTLVSACSEQSTSVLVINGNTMGTTYNIKVVNDESLSILQDPIVLKQEIDDLLKGVNQLMSTYMEDSELSLLNQSPKNLEVTISTDTRYVILEALRLHAMSNGKLDITVGPLVNLWGFGPTFRPEKLPSAAQLNAVKDFVGINKFTLLENAIVKHHSNVYIDLSTIAKGFGVDKIAELLLSKGINNFLVEIGGEMRVSGHKPGQQNWLVAIEKPISHARAVQRIVHIGNGAIASSGDYRNYYEEEGRRYSHLIDPATGYPIQHNLVAVSVVADKSITADGLATALMVMGKEDGLKMAIENDIAALFITKHNEEFIEYTTPAFDARVNIID